MRNNGALERTVRRILALAFLVPAAFLQAQTTVYLRSSGPAGTYVTGASKSGVSPFHLIVHDTTGLTSGDIISVVNACANDGVYSISVANGIRKIASVNSGTDLTITDQSGRALTSNGDWCAGYNPVGGFLPGAQYIGKLTPFSLVSGQPLGWFDGPTGDVTRKWALGTQNGLTSLVVDSSHNATVTTSYVHGVTTGNHITVWGTTNATLNNGRAVTSDYVVALADAKHFVFPVSSSIPAADYTTNAACGPGATPNGTIQGTDNCVRISQLATINNPIWAKLYPNIANNIIVNNIYKSIGDDANGQLGKSGPVSVVSSYWAPISTLFLVDQSSVPTLSALVYMLTHIHRLSGAGFIMEETQGQGGNGELDDYGSGVFENLASVYSAGSPYLTSAQKTTALSRIYADITDSPACTKGVPLAKVLAIGTAAAGSSSTITLAADPGHGDGYYANNEIIAVVGAAKSYGLVTGYVASTKIATVASWSNGSPTTGTTYTIYATISRSGTTITGYNTTFNTDVAAGGVVYGSNAWPGTPSSSGTYVTSISSDTSLSGRNGAYIVAGATPGILWYVNQPTSDTLCGLKWVHNHWGGAPTAQPLSYGNSGGSYSAVNIPPYTQPYAGSNNANSFDRGRMTMALAAAADEPRAVIDLAAINTHWWDYEMAYSMTYTTGFAQSGSHYSFARTFQDGPAPVWILKNSVIGYPSLDPTGPWITAPSIIKMFSAMPDAPWAGGYGAKQYPTLWGAASQDFITSAAGAGQAGMNYVADAGLEDSPSASSSQYFQDWLLTHNGYSWPYAGSGADLALKLDPRHPRSTYTAQPLQYLFSATSYAACQTLFGGTCPYPQPMRGDAFISRTGWTTNTDSLLQVQARTYAGDHDNGQPGSLQLYKVGFLLANDTTITGSADADSVTGLFDPTKNDVAFEFGGTNTINQSGLLGQTMTMGITRWASANHGSFPTAYGDQNSNYACATMDFGGVYTTTYNAVQRTICDFKKPGTEHVIVQYDYVDATGHATAIRNQVHYPQNGETISDWTAHYDEGTTTCPGSGGCASLDTNRTVLEQETGVADGHGDPTPQYNLITNFLSPPGTTMTVRWDGSTYTGSNHHTNRVSLCGGSSCGSTVSKFEDLIVHKVATQPDTTLTVKPLNPDSKWTGVQTNDKVVLFARYGNTPLTVTFQTDHPGTAQYLIAGLQGGMVYGVHKNGISGMEGVRREPAGEIARQLVSEGDNTLYFEAPAGNYTIAPERLANLLIGDDLKLMPGVGFNTERLTKQLIGSLPAVQPVDPVPAIRHQ